ncbi:hypothetical protein RDABS01_031564 [Bienertia sinuspersici]
MKTWIEDINLTKEIDKTIPIWVHVFVHLKFWGIRALEKILKTMGKLLSLDATTAKREKLQYARVMVEVAMDQYFPDSVTFCNKKAVRNMVIMRVHAIPSWESPKARKYGKPKARNKRLKPKGIHRHLRKIDFR